MAWSIAELARTSKVTSRTLRHYDDIGLLPPAYTDRSGRRYYERTQLVRLQQILVLRELDLGLDQIGEVLNGATDQVEALRMHRRWLLRERDRLNRLATTVARTIEDMEGGSTMSADELFSGFEPDSEQAQRLAKEAADRWGDTVTESNRRVKGWSKEKWAAVNKQGADATTRIAELAGEGLPVTDQRVLDAVGAHHEWLRHHWEPNAESYAGLGRLYAEDERFRGQFEAIQPGLADYLRDAMAEYAGQRLS